MATPATEVPIKEPEAIDLDTWFDEEEEDLSADEPEGEEEESSTASPPEGESPDEETPPPDADKSALDEGTSAKPTQEDPYSWVQELDPEVRKRAEALVNHHRSNSGRVAALQSRLDEVEAERLAHASSSGDRRPEQAVVSEAEEVVVDKELSEFLKEFPTVAQNVQKMIDERVQKEREEILGQVRPIQERQQSETILAERKQLRDNAAIIFNSEVTGLQLEDVLTSPAWKQWMDSQPDGYRDFANRAPTAADATKVLEDFAAYSEKAALEEYYRQNPEEATKGEEQEKPESGNADLVAEQRRQALKGSTPPSKSGSLDNSGLSTYEDWFEHYAEKKSKR